MTTTSTTRERLHDLGAALHAAAAADLVHSDRRRRRRKVAGVLVATAIVIPGAALGAGALISNEDVATSIPNGTVVLMGTNPKCKTIRANVEFDCVVARAPRDGDVAAGAWKGTVEPTVDRNKRVSGGCRSLDANGMHWRCYVGEEAVRRQIIGRDLLGESAPRPGAG
jgi:hypothetical protein